MTADLEYSVNSFSRALHALDIEFVKLRTLSAQQPTNAEKARELAAHTAQRAQDLIQAAQLLAHNAEIEIERTRKP